VIQQPYQHCLLLALLLSTAVFSYGQETIIGKVQGETGNPIAYANVLLLKNGDSALVKGTITEDNGTFLLENIPEGKYVVSARLIGFKPTATDPFDFGGDSNVKLPPIILFEGVELDEVTVSSKKNLYAKK